MDVAQQTNLALEKFWKPAAALVILCIIGGVAYHFKTKQDVEAQKNLANDFYQIKAEVDEVAKTLNLGEEPNPLAKAENKKEKAKPEKIKADLAPGIERLMSFITANEGSISAIEAALYVNELTEEYNDAESAIKAFKTAVNGADKENFLYAVAKDELANKVQQQGSCEESIKIWKELASIKQQAFMADSYNLKSGVCLEELGQLDQAQGLYQEIASKSPDSFSGQTAKKFLRFLEYKKAQKRKSVDKAVSDQKG